MTLLETKNLTKSFGGLVAVNNVDFKAREYERVGIIGPNGAGKTTLVNLISGYYPPSEGRVLYLDEDITHLSASQRTQKGIVRTFQLASIFNDLQVIENVALAYLRFSNTYKSFKLRFLGKLLSQDILDLSLKALKEVELDDEAYRLSSELPYGERRKLEIAMALSLNPKIILIDEPFSGLSETEIPDIIKLLKRHAHERTVVAIDHKVSKIIEFVSRLCAMHEGKIICEGKPDEVISDPEVRRVYWKYEK